jgi:metal-dependent amidase/aminoacylase/carboxypeptidase family protein
VAREVAGKDKVNTDCAPLMGAEDFAFMLQERPGAFIYIGNGNSAQRQQKKSTSSQARDQLGNGPC